MLASFRLTRRTAVLALLAAACGFSPSPEGSSCTDIDGDGFGAVASTACVFPQRDCDDGNPFVNPGAIEICGNGFDDDCRDGDLPCGDADGDADVEEADGDDVTADGEIDGDDGGGGDDLAEVPDGAEVADEVDAGPCCDADGDTYGEGPGCRGHDCDDHAASVTTGCTVLFEDWLAARR